MLHPPQPPHTAVRYPLPPAVLPARHRGHPNRRRPVPCVPLLRLPGVVVVVGAKPAGFFAPPRSTAGGNSPLLPDGFADRAATFRCPWCWPGAPPAGDPRDRAGAPPKPLARFPRQPRQPTSLPSGSLACVLPSLCLSLSARLSERVLRPWKQLRFLPARTSFVSSADPRGSPFRALLGAVRHSPGGHGSPPARTSPLQ